MSTRAGKGRALLVVDVQVGVVATAWDRERVIGNIALAVQRARDAGVPVVWVQHHADDLPRDSADWQWVPELQPRAGEMRLHKRFNSSFEDTGLADWLDAQGISHLYLAGAATNWCIRATAYGALDRGYDLTLIGDAHTTRDAELEPGRRLEARAMVDDLNVAMRWLEYPGRRNTVVLAADATFAAQA